jgi:hypothetical protein
MTEKQVEDVMVTDTGEVTPEHASTNFFWTYGTEERFNIQTTVRGILSEDEIAAHVSSAIAAMKRVTEIGGHAKQVGKPNGNGGQPQQNVAQNTNAPNDDPSWCKIHDEQMKQWDKDGRTWFSHKVGDDWCKGK